MSSATVNEFRFFGEFASSLLNDGNDGPRAGLDDTLNSADSRVGNPFSATVVDQGDTKTHECTVTSRRLKCRAKSKGHTGMVLRLSCVQSWTREDVDTSSSKHTTTPAT